MFEDLIKIRERVLCGTCEKDNKYYAKELIPGDLYKCEVCGKSFGAAGQRKGTVKNPRVIPVPRQ